MEVLGIGLLGIVTRLFSILVEEGMLVVSSEALIVCMLVFCVRYDYISAIVYISEILLPACMQFARQTLHVLQVLLVLPNRQMLPVTAHQ